MIFHILYLSLHWDFRQCWKRFRFRPYQVRLQSRTRIHHLLIISTISLSLKVIIQNTLMTCHRRLWTISELPHLDHITKQKSQEQSSKIMPRILLQWHACRMLTQALSHRVTPIFQASPSVSSHYCPCKDTDPSLLKSVNLHNCSLRQEEFPIPHSVLNMRIWGTVLSRWCILRGNMFPAPPLDPW